MAKQTEKCKYGMFCMRRGSGGCRFRHDFDGFVWVGGHFLLLLLAWIVMKSLAQQLGTSDDVAVSSDTRNMCWAEKPMKSFATKLF